SATKSMHTKKEEFPPPLIITRVILRLFQQSRWLGIIVLSELGREVRMKVVGLEIGVWYEMQLLQHLKAVKRHLQSKV
ncbi:hypothetical protein, partial [Bacillus sp. OK048]|uniref:hypothetical protein n=1 Tax=Bacillus sp. OK048 TaxID=1882761 RepID=UPI00088CB7B8